MKFLKERPIADAFFPKGRTYSPPRRNKRELCRFRAGTKARPFRCSSSPHIISDFAGSPWAAVYCLTAAVRSCGGRKTMIAMTKGGDAS